MKSKRRLYNYNLSHNVNTTCQMGKIIPLDIIPTLPGDVFKLSSSAFIRMSPMMKPVMHPIRAEIRHFFVPDRIVWDELEDFHTGGQDGMSTPDHPYIEFSSIQSRSLMDYMGIPIGNYPAPMRVNALPFRAYNMIWNYYFRDQDLQDELVISTASGKDTTTVRDIQRCAWAKDYFTVARPFAQKGPSVSLNIGDITLNGNASLNVPSTSHFLTSPTVGVNYTGLKALGTATDTDIRWNNNTTIVSSNRLVSNDATKATGEISVAGQAGAVAITDLRFAFQMQSYLEQLSRTGNRYDDVLRSVFGVRIRNEFIDEPVYIGGDKQTLQISEVINTTADGLGSLGGHGVGAMGSGRYTYRAAEWGHVITVMYIRPETIYMDALCRNWSKWIREDYYNPFFALVGQQEVKNQEVQARHNDADGLFGFADRYDEYRDIPSIVTGEFRTLEKDWHLARELPTDVALNSSFISCVPSNRIFAEQSGDFDHFQCMVRNKIQALRPVIRNPKPRLGM